MIDIKIILLLGFLIGNCYCIPQVCFVYESTVYSFLSNSNFFPTISQCVNYLNGSDGYIYIYSDLNIQNEEGFMASGTIYIQPSSNQLANINVISGHYLNIQASDKPLTIYFSSINFIGSTENSTSAIKASGTVGCNLYFQSVTMQHFSANQGSAVNSNNFPLTFNSTLLAYNHAFTNGGAVYSNNIVTFLNFSNVYGNTAVKNGGGVYATQINATNTSFYYNSAFNGGGLYVDDLYMNLCNAYGNLANNSGGAVSFTPNSQFANIYSSAFSYNNASYYGGGIYSYNFPFNMIKSRIYNSEAKYGGAIYVYGLEPNVNQLYNLSQSYYRYNTAISGAAVYSGYFLNIYGGIFMDSSSDDNLLKAFPEFYLNQNNADVLNPQACTSRPVVLDNIFDSNYLCINVIGSCEVNQGLAVINLNGQVVSCSCEYGYVGPSCSQSSSSENTGSNSGTSSYSHEPSSDSSDSESSDSSDSESSDSSDSESKDTSTSSTSGYSGTGSGSYTGGYTSSYSQSGSYTSGSSSSSNSESGSSLSSNSESESPNPPITGLTITTLFSTGDYPTYPPTDSPTNSPNPPTIQPIPPSPHWIAYIIGILVLSIVIALFIFIYKYIHHHHHHNNPHYHPI